MEYGQKGCLHSQAWFLNLLEPSIFPLLLARCRGSSETTEAQGGRAMREKQPWSLKTMWSSTSLPTNAQPTLNCGVSIKGLRFDLGGAYYNRLPTLINMAPSIIILWVGSPSLLQTLFFLLCSSPVPCSYLQYLAVTCLVKHLSP